MTRHLPIGALILACSTMASMPAVAQLTGTIFTSPEQREYLDYLRQEFLASSKERGFDIDEADIPDIPDAVPGVEEAAGPEFYTLDGIVSLRDGTQRIWLNGKALREAELPSEARLARDNGMLVLRFSTATGSYLLRPGQTLELTAGSVIENYRRQVALEPAEQTANGVEPLQAADPVTDLDNSISTATEASGKSAAVGEEAAQAAALEDTSPTGTLDALRARLEALENAQAGQDDDD